ncbi:hypothetical protein Tco_0185243 [Tanacetum coccineum]
MSDSEDSTVTYTEVSSPFEGLSDIGSLGFIGPEYEGLPWMLDDPYVQVVLQAPPSPDYVSGPKEPEQAPPLPDFVPEPVYQKFMPPEDEEDDEEDPEEDPVDYPADEGDDGNDEDESFDDDEDDDVDIEGDEGEEEHPAPADSTAVALPTVDQAPSVEETKPFETDKSAATPPPHLAYRVARLLAIPSPPPSLPSPWSSPLPQIPSPPLHVSPLPLPASPTYPLGYRVAMIQLRVEAPSTSYPLPLPSPIAPPSGTPPLLPIPLPTPLPPLLLPSTDHRADVREACLSPWKRLCFAFGLRYKVGESSSAPTAIPDGDFRRDYGEPTTDETELGRWVIDLVTTVRQDTDEIYGRLDDAQTERQMVTSRVNMLVKDRRAHSRTARLMEIEARMSREAWGWSMDASDLTCTEVMALCTQVVAQQSEITELRAADHMRQTQLTKALKLMKTLHTQLTALQSR